MFNGDSIICDLQEAVDKESGQDKHTLQTIHTKLTMINLKWMLQVCY